MTKAKQLWGGRFSGPTDERFAAFNRSFDFDQRLLNADLKASEAHGFALEQAGVLTASEFASIAQTLGSIRELAATDPHYLDSPESEDVHSFIESRLIDQLGDVGRKLHTGRSRNDQVATAMRLWLREAIDEIVMALREAQTALVEFAESNVAIVIPGYTHLQRAQPVLFAHWCLAYFEMFERDRERLWQARERVNVLPLGSAALAGTSYAIDRNAVAERLGFASVTRNSLDAVSDRDFCVDLVSAAALVMVHLSRLAEDIILYASTEFGFLRLGDAIATGSSLMPQKKNPDSMELVRGKSGRVFGHLQALLTMLKGLPLAYNKDMQEDKEAVFDAVKTVRESLAVTGIVLRNISVDGERANAAARSGYLNATELADYLVGKGLAFRDAHEIVGKVVLHAIKADVELDQLPITDLKDFSPVFAEDVFDAISLDRTLSSKDQVGGTSTRQVTSALKAARASLLT